MSSCDLDIELQLDVVRLECIDVQRGAEVGAQEGAGRAGGVDGDGEWIHESGRSNQKKWEEKMNSPPILNLTKNYLLLLGGFLGRRFFGGSRFLGGRFLSSKFFGGRFFSGSLLGRLF